MTKKKIKKRVLIDLDGVLNKYSGKFNENYIPPINEKAKEFVEKLSCEYELKLFTTRDNNLAKKWLEDNGLAEYFSGVTCIKEPAYALIDDRCIQFRGNYQETADKLKTFKVRWEI